MIHDFTMPQLVHAYAQGLPTVRSGFLDDIGIEIPRTNVYGPGAVPVAEGSELNLFLTRDAARALVFALAKAVADAEAADSK